VVLSYRKFVFRDIYKADSPASSIHKIIKPKTNSLNESIAKYSDNRSKIKESI